ncbi:MAG: acyltransferase [Deltaproteobacteria bacterium]|nr:acyltransferase [Deltaproteobacteria bacterium]
MFISLKQHWTRFWMKQAGLSGFGRVATHFATIFAPPHKASAALAKMNPKGYITPTATIYHRDIQLGANIFLGDRVLVYQAKGGGQVRLGDRVCILRDSIIETGEGGNVIIGADTYIHPRCQLNAYKASIEIGRGVMLAANCAIYPHEHGIAPNLPIRQQALQTKGLIIVGDHAWLGTGVIVLGGVRIGNGTVIGAGSVVTKDLPDNAIAFGVPARVVKMRSDLVLKDENAA